MTYAEIFSEIKGKFTGADVSDIKEHLAFQFNITGEGSGIFYVEVKDGSLKIEPYEYFDKDATFICSADTLRKIADGKLDPALEICELINRADVTVLVIDEIRRDVKEIAKQQCPNLKHIISIQQKESDEQALSFWQLLNDNSGEFDYTPNPEDLCTIMFTSGTTGKSKGVMLTQRNLAENATCLDMKIPSRTVILSVLPIHHAYCLSMDILKGVSLGVVNCINDSLLRVAKNIKLFKPNMILMVPLMIETIAKKLEEAKGIPALIVKMKVFGKQFHTICSGGAYLNPAYIDLFKKYGITILQGYGMTECSPVISTNLSWNIKKNSVGRLMPNCQAKVVDDELWVKGSSVMQGYYKMPEEIKNKIGENRLVCEILVRENEGVIEAEIFPDYEYAEKKKIKNIQDELQKIIDEYNLSAPAYKKVYKLSVREKEFEKTPSKKIKRY